MEIFIKGIEDLKREVETKKLDKNQLPPSLFQASGTATLVSSSPITSEIDEVIIKKKNKISSNYSFSKKKIFALFPLA